MAKVTVIKPTISSETLKPIDSITKRRVAAYARVSTDSDEQYTSYEMQVKYYKQFIESNPEWEFDEVYADEGISGTSTKNRKGFNRMIDKAMKGGIDLILTKSISRFARNTLDTISYMRKLKAKGVEVYFEKENIWSFDSKGELILTIMASIAQEESRSISENVKWGIRNGMKEGRFRIPVKNFLGYKRNASGEIVVDEEEAKTVRDIYEWFLLDGMTATGIAEKLRSMGIFTPSKKNTNWSKQSVMAILTNEKYKGDSLLQKVYIESFLDHNVKRNNGILPQYYVENSHPAIISKENWAMVQDEIKRRVNLGQKYDSRDIFSCKLKCADCGSFYGKKIWHSNEPKYRQIIYRCNHKYENKDVFCKTPNVREEQIKSMFIKAYNSVMANKESVIEDTTQVIELLTDTSDNLALIDKLEKEIVEISEKVSSLVKESGKVIGNEVKFMEEYSNYSNRYEEAKKKLQKAREELDHKNSLKTKLEVYLHNINDINEVKLENWDDRTWRLMVVDGLVERDGSITFNFYNGSSITINP